MSNNLKRDKQIATIQCLVEGTSIRSAERMTGVHRDTIMRLGIRAGEGCQTLMDAELRNLPCKLIQVDEIWGYVGKKQRHIGPEDDQGQCGDFWTWVAIDADTKLVPSHHVGKRTLEDAIAFLGDLDSRLMNRVQLSSDALSIYVEAVERIFGADVDYGQIVKSYEAEPIGPGRYSPPKVVGVRKKPITGNPKAVHVSTSYVERQNLTMRMSIRRLTRLTNAFSKKSENLRAAVALHFAYYNFVRMHRSLRCTPAMAAGVANNPWTIGDLLDRAL